MPTEVRAIHAVVQGWQKFIVPRNHVRSDRVMSAVRTSLVNGAVVQPLNLLLCLLPTVLPLLSGSLPLTVDYTC